MSRIPSVVSSYVGFMSRSAASQRAGLADLWDRLQGLRGNNTREAKRVASEMGLDPLAASWHCRKLVVGVEYPTGDEMLATVLARLETARDAARARSAQPRRPDPYHPGAPTLPGNRSPSA